jgi:hypothetical protein
MSLKKLKDEHYLTKSNPFRMSSLKRSIGILRLWRRLARLRIYMHLLWILLLLMNALCALETRSFMRWASRIAIILAMIFRYGMN